MVADQTTTQTAMQYEYTVRRPITSSVDLRADPIISQHSKLARAIASLRRQRAGARAQGGYSRDYIVRESDGSLECGLGLDAQAVRS